uniref:Uncharacterized protein n=1 Tax=Acrobeloides nanus TaxID=290746 RepID=A0A914E0J7_9BILA
MVRMLTDVVVHAIHPAVVVVVHLDVVVVAVHPAVVAVVVHLAVVVVVHLAVVVVVVRAVVVHMDTKVVVVVDMVDAEEVAVLMVAAVEGCAAKMLIPVHALAVVLPIAVVLVACPSVSLRVCIKVVVMVLVERSFMAVGNPDMVGKDAMLWNLIGLWLRGLMNISRTVLNFDFFYTFNF